MATPYEKTIGFLTDLAACLCVEMERAGVPPLCYCGVIMGEIATGDLAGDPTEGCEGGGCGMAWVRLSGGYPSNATGIAEVVAGNCARPLGIDVEVGAMRCVPTLQEGGLPPTPQQIATAVEVQIKDMHAMRKAIMCCNDNPDVSLILGTYTPMGPLGGFGGGMWPMSVMLS